MIINDNLYKNLSSLKQCLDIVLDYNSLTDLQLENFLRNFEKVRYSMLSEIKLYNKNVTFNYEKIKTVNDDYSATLENDILKIYVPETMPSFKNLKTHTYKRILLNVAEITRPYTNLFTNQVCIYIKVYDKILGWDIDNKYVKPIADALIMSNVIQDDNICKMFYCVKGEFSEIPHTEIYVFDVQKKTDFFNLIVRESVLKWTFEVISKRDIFIF